MQNQSFVTIILNRREVANETAEDRVIWLYGIGEDGVIAFTDFGIENFLDLIKLHKKKLWTAQAATPPPAAHAEWIPRSRSL
jgi:hypothetical protein